MAELKRMSVEDAQRLLPGHREWRQEREDAVNAQVDRLTALWKKGKISGEALYIAWLLIICGLPVKPTNEFLVERRARTGKHEFVYVTFSCTDKSIPLPYGLDRLMLYFQTTRSVRRQSKLLDWNDVNEYLALFGKFERSGRNHKIAQERFIRLAFLNITVKITNSETGTTESFKVPFIEAAAFSGMVDEATGKWASSVSPKKMLLEHLNEAHIGDLFFNRFLKKAEHGEDPRGRAVPVPVELCMAFGNQPRKLDMALFLYWRCIAARTESVIPWEQLNTQFDSRLGDAAQWRYSFTQLRAAWRLLPEPLAHFPWNIEKQGILVRPLPAGLEIFPEKPVGLLRSSVGAE